MSKAKYRPLCPECGESNSVVIIAKVPMIFSYINSSWVVENVADIDGELGTQEFIDGIIENICKHGHSQFPLLCKECDDTVMTIKRVQREQITYGEY